jgi:hypothetical protein
MIGGVPPSTAIRCWGQSFLSRFKSGRSIANNNRGLMLEEEGAGGTGFALGERLPEER